MSKEHKAHSWSWKMEDEELREQVDGYESLKITETYRGISVLLVSALLILSLILGYFEITSLEDVLFSLIIYIPILIFVYLGHRWAIIALLILWTLEKIMTAYFAVESGGSPIGSIIWFFIVTPYIYRALLVENYKHKQSTVTEAAANTQSQYCPECGKPNNIDANFCKECGNNLN